MRARVEKSPVVLTPILVSVIAVIIYVDTHSLHPILSRYAKSMGASVVMAGIIVAAYSIFEDLFEFIFGYLMDKFGRKKIFILLGMIGDSLAMLLYAFSGSPISLLGVRFFHGFSGSVAGPAIMSLVSEIPHPLAKLGARMGLYGSSIILASIIGWLVGGFVAAKLGYRFFFYFVALLVLAGALSSIFIKETKSEFSKTTLEGASEVGPRDAIRRVSRLVRRAGLMIACLGILSHMITMGAMTILLPLRFEQLGLTSSHVGMTLASYGIAALVFQIPMGYLSEKHGRYPLLFAGFLVVSFSMLALSVARSFSLFVVIGAVYGAGFSFLFPTLSSMVIENSKPEERAMASSLFHIMFTQGVVAGAFLFSFIAQETSYSVGLRSSAAVPFLFLVGVFLWWKRHEV